MSYSINRHGQIFDNKTGACIPVTLLNKELVVLDQYSPYVQAFIEWYYGWREVTKWEEVKTPLLLEVDGVIAEVEHIDIVAVSWIDHPASSEELEVQVEDAEAF